MKVERDRFGEVRGAVKVFRTWDVLSWLNVRPIDKSLLVGDVHGARRSTRCIFGELSNISALRKVRVWVDEVRFVGKVHIPTRSDVLVGIKIE
jgi:hypothetical protein